MAKILGSASAFYCQTTAVSSAVVGGALSRIGTTLWYMVASSANYFWDAAKTIAVLDGVTPVTPLEIDHASGAVRLAAAAVGAVTANFSKFACAQVGGFRSFTIDEGMETEESGCFEDVGEIHEAIKYSASGSGEGLWSSVDSFKDVDGLTLFAKPLGALGDAIGVEVAVAGNNTPLTVTVLASAITVNAATSGAGASTSTLRNVRDAIEASAPASDLVKCAYTAGHTGAEVIGAVAHGHLAGGAVPAMLAQFGENLLAVFYWNSGASLIRTVGTITFEKHSIKTGVKGLVGKTVSWKVQGMMYDRSG
jgi:hypothetical protein